MQTLFNQLVYFGFFQSLFLLGVYAFSAKNRKHINGYIVFLVFVLMIGLSGRVLYLSEIFGEYYRLTGISEFANLLFGTTVYLYTRSSLLGARFSIKSLIHYLPALIYSSFILFYYLLPADAIISERVQNGELFSVINYLIGFALVFNIGYWLASLFLFLKVHKQLVNELSYTIKTQFFMNFLVAIGLCLLVWTIIYLLSITGMEGIERIARQGIWLAIAFIIMFIAFYGLSEPALFRQQAIQLTPKYAQSKLTASDLNQLKETLNQLMEEKKPYLNNKLLKAELAEMMGISNPELARLLNESIGMNFFEYVNYYRIKEFIELAKSEQAEKMTFFGLAQEAGFNSKTTFNKSFKKLMGMTPRVYLKNKK